MSTSTVVPFDLPSVLVPPEVIELEVLSTESSEDAPIKREEWPEYMLRLFDNDVLKFQIFPVVDLHIFAHLGDSRSQDTRRIRSSR
jgi:hypothetical protein